MREPSSCGIRRAEGETGAGRVALVWNYMLQPSARPQGVPVGPQSTCHAPDRGASTMSIAHPLGLMHTLELDVELECSEAPPAFGGRNEAEGKERTCTSGIREKTGHTHFLT